MAGKTALVLALLAAVGSTAACSRLPSVKFWDRSVPGGVPYRSSLSDQRDGTLVVTVQAPGASVAAVRESVRFPVTQHCLKMRGSSDAIWVTDASGDWAATRDERGGLTFRARCRA